MCSLPSLSLSLSWIFARHFFMVKKVFRFYRNLDLFQLYMVKRSNEKFFFAKNVVFLHYNTSSSKRNRFISISIITFRERMTLYNISYPNDINMGSRPDHLEGIYFLESPLQYTYKCTSINPDYPECTMLWSLLS